jgi:hypothetical protein
MVARFYGFSDADIEEMHLEDFINYSKAIEMLEAKEMLVNMKIMDYPKMKQEARKQLFQGVHKKAYPGAYSEQKALSTEDVAAMLKQRL